MENKSADKEPKLRVGFDLDGVLYDFTESLRQYMIDEYDFKREELPDPAQWNTWESWGITKGVFLRYFREGVGRGAIWRVGELEPGALEVMNFLRENGDKIHIVTHRNGQGAAGMANTALWLEDERVPFDTLTFGADKCCVPVDIFIEDNVDNYRALEASGVVPVLFTRPWNVNAPSAFRRVSSMAEFGEMVERYRSWRAEYPLLKNHRAGDYL